MKANASFMVLALAGIAASEGKPLHETCKYMEFPNALPGKILKICKSSGSLLDGTNLVSNLPEVSDVADLLRLEAEEERLHRAAAGNLDDRLVERLQHMNVHEKIRVAVKVKTPSYPLLDKTRHGEDLLIENARRSLSQPPVLSPLDALARNRLSALELRGNDIAVVTAGRDVLEVLKNDPDIAAVWEDIDQSLLSVELSTLAPSGYNPGPVPSGAGSGVRAATFEYGLTSTFLSCIGVTPAAYDAYTGGIIFTAEKRHSQATFRTLAASSPSASLYHRNSVTYNSTNDVNYLINNNIQTVSMSVARGGANPERATYSEFLTMDNLAFTYPYPVFVNPTGNLGYDYEVNWQCYNCLSVGNVRHTNNSTFEMTDRTQTKNPPPRYGYCPPGSNCIGDREMPHVVAPGAPSSGSDFATTCLEGTGTLISGSSFSVSVANGMAAAVIAADSRMASWPEKVRATLILTAQNVESGDWTTSGDERDGTGTISGSDAVAFASGHTTVSPGNSACVSGMGASSFYASDFGSNKRFYYQVPNPMPSGKHLRVVLTWDSNPNVSNGTNDLSDLDLVVQKNSGTQSSSSWDSNVEVVDVAAANLTAGSSYYIDISPFSNRIPSGAYFYYAIGWTWVKDHAP